MVFEYLKRNIDTLVIGGGLLLSTGGAVYEYTQNKLALSLFLASDMVIFTYLLLENGRQRVRERKLSGQQLRHEMAHTNQPAQPQSPDLVEKLAEA